VIKYPSAFGAGVRFSNTLPNYMGARAFNGIDTNSPYTGQFSGFSNTLPNQYTGARAINGIDTNSPYTGQFSGFSNTLPNQYTGARTPFNGINMNANPFLQATSTSFIHFFGSSQNNLFGGNGNVLATNSYSTKVQPVDVTYPSLAASSFGVAVPANGPLPLVLFICSHALCQVSVHKARTVRFLNKIWTLLSPGALCVRSLRAQRNTYCTHAAFSLAAKFGQAASSNGIGTRHGST
jgi:hypothetical protein